MGYVRVALDVPITELFDYRIEDAQQAVGRRVAVAFGRRSLVGLAVEAISHPAVDEARVKSACLFDELPRLPPAWFELMRFCASYYHHPLGEAMLAALPARLKQGRPVDPLLWQCLIWHGSMPEFSPRDRVRAKLAGMLASRPCFGFELAGLSPIALKQVGLWQAEGRVVKGEAAAFRVGDLPDLNKEQQSASDALAPMLANPRFGAFLLHGVTGSGKTEVYLRAVAAVLAMGGQALVLVPEINLTPRLLAVFRERFPSSIISLLHSSLGESERLHYWLLAHTGGADIVLGTRLAVLAPMPRLRLIVVDEEHDPSFKQQEGMRYSARDLAVFRAKNEGIPVVLGSATPSLETYAHAVSGRYVRLPIQQRAVTDAVLPQVIIVDLNVTPAEHGVARSVWAALAERLNRGEQSLMFLNRRGFAPVLSCASCGWVSACTQCTAYLVLHRGRSMLTGGKLMCHHCGHVEAVPDACPTCGNVDILAYGQGTQRLEARVAEAFPQARVLRIDRDSTTRKGAAEALLDQVHAGDADILVGTQMLAKGHDFKNLTLVAAINVDGALFTADFRASERLFAQLTQVSGRAGRAGKPGEVLIQTRKPEHPLFHAVRTGNYDRFARSLLAEREAAGLPPFGYQAMLRVEAAKLDAALAFLKQAATPDLPAAGVTIYDPVPMTLTRLKNVERAQLMVESPSRPALQAFLALWIPWLTAHVPSALRWHIEVDPLEL